MRDDLQVLFNASGVSNDCPRKQPATGMRRRPEGRGLDRHLVLALRGEEVGRDRRGDHDDEADEDAVAIVALSALAPILPEKLSDVPLRHFGVRWAGVAGLEKSCVMETSRPQGL